MKTKQVTITPEMASEILSKNTGNRNIRQQYVESIAALMKNHKWKLSPQGITIGESGNLLDGQHRLSAVVLANTPIDFIVFTDVNDSVMDVLDSGAKRTIGDQFTRHGICNGHNIAAIVSIISFICCRDHSKQSTVQSLEVYNIFKKSIDFVYKTTQSSGRTFVKSPVLGALAFCYNSMPEELNSFILSFSSGENLTSDSQPFVLRKYLLNLEKRLDRKIVYPVGTACMYFVNKEKLSQLKISTIGLDFFARNQQPLVKKVCKIYGKE